MPVNPKVSLELVLEKADVKETESRVSLAFWKTEINTAESFRDAHYVHHLPGHLWLHVNTSLKHKIMIVLVVLFCGNYLKVSNLLNLTNHQNCCFSPYLVLQICCIDDKKADARINVPVYATLKGVSDSNYSIVFFFQPFRVCVEVRFLQGVQSGFWKFMQIIGLKFDVME